MTTTTYPTILKDKFNAAERTGEDIAGKLATHFSHVSETGESVFNLTRKCARWILHNCRHTLPAGKKVEGLFRFKSVLEEQGIKGSWPKKPVRINVTTNTIEDGTLRLFALAISDTYGTYMPIEIVN
jgi:hypothetical protein